MARLRNAKAQSVLQTVIMNWEYVGGSRGMSVLRPSGPPFGNYVNGSLV